MLVIMINKTKTLQVFKERPTVTSYNRMRDKHNVLVTTCPGAIRVPPHTHVLRTTINTCQGYCWSYGACSILPPQPLLVVTGSENHKAQSHNCKAPIISTESSQPRSLAFFDGKKEQFTFLTRERKVQITLGGLE